MIYGEVRGHAKKKEEKSLSFMTFFIQAWQVEKLCMEVLEGTMWSQQTQLCLHSKTHCVCSWDLTNALKTFAKSFVNILNTALSFSQSQLSISGIAWNLQQEWHLWTKWPITDIFLHEASSTWKHHRACLSWPPTPYSSNDKYCRLNIVKSSPHYLCSAQS